ncbi:hypothetical protein IMSAGC018_01217 [Lachnospiraceae bacterium]|nr:hypothetical protein IMSAGC018_01217 [Lachnospiraceae bacterium]
MNVLELAQMNDLEICMDIIKDGKNFQNEQGFTQWTDYLIFLENLHMRKFMGHGEQKAVCRYSSNGISKRVPRNWFDRYYI